MVFADKSHLDILLVDDDALVRHVIADELEEAGHLVTPAVGPEAAIELLDESDGYDLILIDYSMPNMSGTELARHILRGRPDAKLAILTGNTELADNAPCPVLAKAVRMAELIRAIETVAAGGKVELAHDAATSRVELMIDQIATRPAVGGVRGGIGKTYEAPVDEEMPDAFASILERLPEK